MTWTRSRSCSQSTVSICLVQGRSAIPPQPNLSIAVLSEPFSEPTVVAILTSPCIMTVDVDIKSSRILVLLVKNQEISRCCQWQVCVDMLSLHLPANMCHFFAFLRQILSGIFSMFCVVFVVVVELNVYGLQHHSVLYIQRDVKRSCDWLPRLSLPKPTAPHVTKLLPSVT